MGSVGSRFEITQGTAAVATGLGLLTFALFPLALPILILTIVATLPLALPVVVLAAVGAILMGVWLGMRAVGRGVRRLGRRPTSADVGVGRRSSRPSEVAVRGRSADGASVGPLL